MYDLVYTFVIITCHRAGEVGSVQTEKGEKENRNEKRAESVLLQTTLVTRHNVVLFRHSVPSETIPFN